MESAPTIVPINSSRLVLASALGLGLFFGMCFALINLFGGTAYAAYLAGALMTCF